MSQNQNFKQLQGQLARPGSTRGQPSNSLLHQAAQRGENHLGFKQFTDNQGRVTSIPPGNTKFQGGKENSSGVLNRAPGGYIRKAGNEDQTGMQMNGLHKHINFKDGLAAKEQFNQNHGGASRGAIKTYQAEKPRSALGQAQIQRSSSNQIQDQQPQDLAPVGAQNEFSHASFLRGTESPPSLSLTASPERTTEKKSTMTELNAFTRSEERRQNKMIKINCIGCNGKGRSLLCYDEFPSYGNCQDCGNFAYVIRNGDQLESLSQGVRNHTLSFHAQVPMDAILKGLTALQTNGRVYCPRAFYVVFRRYWVDWMYQQGEKLGFQPETYQHSINVFDAYLQLPGIVEHLQSLNLLRIRTDQETSQVLMLIAVACMFISAKYLEKTYPGFQQLVHITGLPYSYQDFIKMETDVLNSLKWEVQYISVYDVLTHFICQGLLFTSDVIIDANRSVSSRQRQHDIKVKAAMHIQKFTEFCSQMCLQYHEFLQYDQVTLASAIVMAARSKIKVQDPWPVELVAMSGGITDSPSMKSLAKKILSYYDGIIPQASSSPEQPQTVQKTVKRGSHVEATATVSIKKRGREQNSQDQTTTKKVASNSVGATTNPEVETPSKQLATKNTLATMVKNGSGVLGQKKQLKVKLNRGVSSSSGTKATSASLVKDNSSSKEQQILQGLSSSKKPTDSQLKSTESHKDSQPSKKTHILQKQDSSKYLRGDEKRQQQMQQRMASSTHRSTAEGRVIGKPSTKNLQLRVGNERMIPSNSRDGAQTSKAAMVNKAVNNIALAEIIAQQARGSSQGSTQSNIQGSQHIATGLGSYLYHQPSSFSKQSVGAPKMLSREREGSVNFNTANMLQAQVRNSSAGNKALKITMGASSGLKKVMPHPMLRPKQSGSELPVFLNSGNNSHKKVILTKVRTSVIDKSSCNVSGSVNGNIHQSSGAKIASASTNAPASAGTKLSSNKIKSVSSLGPTGSIARNSLSKQFESMEMSQNIDKTNAQSQERDCSNFVVNSLTTANQRESSISSQNSVAAYASKLLKNNSLFTQGRPKMTSNASVQPPQVLSCSTNQPNSKPQIGKMNQSSIQSLMQNLKIHNQQSAGTQASSGQMNGSSSGSGSGMGIHTNNSANSLQNHIRNGSNKFSNMILGHRDGANSRSGLSFAANPNASNTARTGNQQMARDIQFRPHQQHAQGSHQTFNGDGSQQSRMPINFHPKPQQQLRVKNVAPMASENEPQATAQHVKAISSSTSYR